MTEKMEDLVFNSSKINLIFKLENKGFLIVNKDKDFLIANKDILSVTISINSVCDYRLNLIDVSSLKNWLDNVWNEAQSGEVKTDKELIFSNNQTSLIFRLESDNFLVANKDMLSITISNNIISDYRLNLIDVSSLKNWLDNVWYEVELAKVDNFLLANEQLFKKNANVIQIIKSLKTLKRYKYE